MKAKKDYEQILADKLEWAGYGFFRQFQFDKDRRWRSDFCLLHHRVLIEVDGVMYRGLGRHQTAEGFTGDCEKLNKAVELGYRVLRFTPKMVLDKATRGKSKIPMPPVMRVIDRVCFGERAKSFDTSMKCYAAEAMLDLSMGAAGKWRSIE